MVSTPKTLDSLRTIPIMPTTLQQLQALRRMVAAENKGTIIKDAFVFPSSVDVFRPRDPIAVTHRVKRFMKRNHLPDLSPHDLRYVAFVSRDRHQERSGDIGPYWCKHDTELLCKSGFRSNTGRY